LKIRRGVGYCVLKLQLYLLAVGLIYRTKILRKICLSNKNSPPILGGARGGKFWQLAFKIIPRTTGFGK